MHEFLSFNGQTVSSKKAKISAASAAGLYGKGVFTTLAVSRKKPVLWEKHWNRIVSHAKRLDINLSHFSKEIVGESLNDLIAANHLENCAIRITFFDESPSEIWKTGAEEKTSLLIISRDFREISNSFLMTVSPFRVNSGSPLAGVKSCNYLENIFARRSAAARKFDEAVRLNERNEIVSACMANIFWIKNEEVFTPKPETGALAGTTREWILENFAVTEVRAKMDEIEGAETVFLTSSGIGIRPVKNLDQTFYKTCNAFEQIKKEFTKFVEAGI